MDDDLYEAAKAKTWAAWALGLGIAVLVCRIFVSGIATIVLRSGALHEFRLVMACNLFTTLVGLLVYAVSVVAMVLAVLAIRTCRKYPDMAQGRGMAWAGAIFTTIAVVLLPTFQVVTIVYEMVADLGRP